jgi:pilus assembly protein TadC
MLIRLGRIIARRRINKVKYVLEYAGIDEIPEKFVGKHALILIFISLVAGILAYIKYGLIIGAISGIITGVMYYFLLLWVLSLLSDQRSVYVEKILPDVLILMATNLRSGVPPEEALVMSARPEFGFLSEKIRLAGKMIASGKSVKEAFLFLKKGINSEVFNRTIDLIVEGIESGGELATLLEATANDIREMETVRKEVRSMIFVYALFIFIAACLIAPVLFAVSIQLSGVLSNLSHSIAVQFMTKNSATVHLAPSGISVDFLKTFAYVNLIIASVFAALIAALISKGNERYGIKYVPFFIIISLVLFFLSEMALEFFFGSIHLV